MNFARYLDKKQQPIWVRHVVVEGYTFNEDYLYELGLFIGSLSNVKALDVLAYHEMGEVKYQNLGMEYPLKGMQALKKEDAIKSGAECMFIEKYPDIVTVYEIGDVSKELYGGPHVKHTAEIGKFKIKKEEASSAGVRRIKAIIED